MSEIQTFGTRITFGTSEQDRLVADSGVYSLYGLEGDDTLISQWDDDEWRQGALAGGSGNDSYHARADITEIIDAAGNDTLHLAGSQDEYMGALLDGRDLVLANMWSGQSVLVIDFTGQGRIETFVDESGSRLGAGEVERLVYSEGAGNIGYAELEAYTGISSSNFNAAREIDIALATLDWNAVFQQLADAGSTDKSAIADAIQTQALPQLSSNGQQLWQDSGAYQALLNSEYQGLEANLPSGSENAPSSPPSLPSIPGFDASFYLQQNPDVAAAGINPVEHFVNYGWQEGRDPNPWFDSGFYLQQNPDVATVGINPVEHFVNYGWQEGRNPNALFDTNFYLQQNPDVAAVGINPVEHFVNYGWQEGRDPSADFDTSDYLDANPELALSGISPLEHALQVG